MSDLIKSPNPAHRGIDCHTSSNMTQRSNGFEFFGKECSRGKVCVCGSTHFYEQFMELQRYLTFNGWIVTACGSWGHSYHKDKPYMHPCTLDLDGIKRLHLNKIQMSNVVVIVTDKTGYRGESTLYEQRFAQHLKRPIFIWNGEEFTSGVCYTMFNTVTGDLDIDAFINHPYPGANPIPS